MVHHIGLATCLANNFSSSENKGVLKRMYHVCDLGSTETVKSSNSEAQLGKNISWYNSSTGVKIKSGDRIELNDLSLKIKNVQLDDAGTYECRGTSGTVFVTIYVNGEFSLCFSCLSFWHYYRCIKPLL